MQAKSHQRAKGAEIDPRQVPSERGRGFVPGVHLLTPDASLSSSSRFICELLSRDAVECRRGGGDNNGAVGVLPGGRVEL